MEPKQKPCPLSKKKPPGPVRTPEEVKMDQALKKFYSRDLFSLPPERHVVDNEFMLDGRRQREEIDLKMMNQTSSDSAECTTDELEPGEVRQDEIPEDLFRKLQDDKMRKRMDSFNPYQERENKFKRLQSFGYPSQNVPLTLYKCEMISCERKFFNLYDYLDHKRLHEIGDLPPYICPVCGARYDKLKRCAIHMSMHRNKGETRAPDTDYTSGHLIMSKAPHPKQPMTQLDADYLLAKKLQDEEDAEAKKKNARPATKTQTSGLDCLAAAAAALMENHPTVGVGVMEQIEFQFGPDEPTQGTVEPTQGTVEPTQGTVEPTQGTVEPTQGSTHGTIEVIDLTSTQESMESQSATGSTMTAEEQLLADFLLAQSLQEEEDYLSRNDYLARGNSVKEVLNQTQIIQHDVETEVENDSDFEMNASEKLQMDLLAARYNAQKRAAGAIVESSSQDSEIIID